MRTRSSGDLIAGKYRLERPLARGGMGEVWTARNLQLDVPVAIKLMSAQALSSLDLVQRFEREAKSAAQLRHQNVVTIFEHGVVDGVPFMAMELLDGQDLSARIRQRGRLSHAEALPIIAGVCKALRRAHEMQIVHRDLKPANVFLVRQDDDEIVKVLDFGIAKILGGVVGAESTKAGGLLGTPHYMAPEQAQSTVGKIDHRADLWALGVIAFRLLTGALPFTGKDPVQVLMHICTARAPLASSIAPELGLKFDAFFDKALARAPADRFQSARDFAEAFASLDGRERVHPLAQSWATAPPSEVEVSPPRPPQGSGSSAHGAIEGPSVQPAIPLPRASSPGAARPPPPASKPFVEDPMDSAQTLPIQSSPQAQAFQSQARRAELLRTLPLAQDSRPGGAMAPIAMAPPPSAAPSPVGPAGPPAPRPSAGFALPYSAPAGPRGTAWPNDAGGTPAIAASNEDGTITRAATEAGPAISAAPRRNTGIVVGALFAAILTVAVVGWSVFAAVTSADSTAELPPIPLPTAQTALVPVPADVPASAPLASSDAPKSTPSESPTASASASAKPAPTASAGASASAKPAPAATTTTPAKSGASSPVKPPEQSVNDKLKKPHF